MAHQTWIAAKCREWGLPVYEDPGWKTRGSTTFSPVALVAHHTAGPATGDYPSLKVVREGRGGPNPLPGPLSQVGLGRSGRVYVIAAGRANHAGGKYDIGWKGIKGNVRRMGIEAESVGTRDDWTAEQRRNYPILCAALLDGMGAAADYLCGHKETATNKVDPAYWVMPEMRADVAEYLRQGPQGQEYLDMAITEERLREIIRAELTTFNTPFLRKASDGSKHYLCREDDGSAVYIDDPVFLNKMVTKYGAPKTDLTDRDINNYYDVD